MLDSRIEPDEVLPEFRCECGECEGCYGNWEWLRNGVTLEQGLRISEFNYQCKLFGELERQIPE